MTITKSWEGRILIASLQGEIDMKSQASLAESLHELASADASALILNLAELSYIASIGIGLFLNLARQAHARGISVRLAAPKPMIRQVLEMVRADEEIPIDNTLADSLQRVSLAA